ncbi:MAG: DedA family protein [Gemmatimonadetes bacterium]|nr:DedA family protein [Gemmatimonadota bacterium]
MLAATENIFPPIPADIAVAVGAFISQAGHVSALSIFFTTWIANVAGAGAVYYGARTVGRDFFAGRIGRRLLKPKLMNRIERIYKRYGVWGIFLSRFVPGARAVIAPFAGIAGLSAVKSMLPVAVASGIWYAGLTFVAATTIHEMEGVLIFVRKMGKTSAVLAGAVVAAAALAFYVRRRARRREVG